MRVFFETHGAVLDHAGYWIGHRVSSDEIRGARDAVGLPLAVWGRLSDVGRPELLSNLSGRSTLQVLHRHPRRFTIITSLRQYMFWHFPRQKFTAQEDVYSSNTLPKSPFVKLVETARRDLTALQPPDSFRNPEKRPVFKCSRASCALVRYTTYLKIRNPTKHSTNVTRQHGREPGCRTPTEKVSRTSVH